MRLRIIPSQIYDNKIGRLGFQPDSGPDLYHQKSGWKPDLRVLRILFLIGIGFFILPALSSAQTPLPKLTIGIDKAASSGDVAVTIQILVLLTVLSLAPSILIMMTSFTRIVVVLHFVRQAIGTQSMPPNQLILGLAMFLTFFTMQKPIQEIYDHAWKPYAANQITIQEAFRIGQEPLKGFMLRQAREKDLALFVRMSDLKQPDNPQQLPLSVIVPGFVISELRIAFQIGFLVYMPFLIIDMVVASVLMSMGMLMLPPVMISLPFKVLMFVLVDGWYLVIESVVKGIK
ncbi:MAG: flagellar type III secretion system pore protein FliP [Calditrichota bacterium]